MNTKEQITSSSSSLFSMIAASTLLIQFLIFFLFYNFTANILVLGLGWLMLFPGSALVLLYARSDSAGKIRLYRFSKYSMHVGWSMISLSLALISQNWITSFLMLLFLILMIIDMNGRQESK
jgi:hypothetical protein